LAVIVILVSPETSSLANKVAESRYVHKYIGQSLLPASATLWWAEGADAHEHVVSGIVVYRNDERGSLVAVARA
jgi:hypothetical protein